MADEPGKKAKRRVKNPETFRERAVKASALSEQPPKRGLLRRVLGAILGPIVRPLGRAIRAFFGLPVFGVLHRPLRLIGKVVFPPYLRNSWRELQLVAWPSWRESRRLTFAVLVFAVIFGAAIAGVDYGLDKLFRHVLLK